MRYEITGVGIAPYLFSLNVFNQIVLNNPSSLRQGIDNTYTVFFPLCLIYLPRFICEI